MQTSCALLPESSPNTGPPYPWCSSLPFCVLLPILVIIFLEYVWIKLYSFPDEFRLRPYTKALILPYFSWKCFAWSNLRIGFAFFTDASHCFRNLISLKGTIKLKWQWNKLIPTLLLCWLSKQSTFLADIFPSLCVRFHLFVMKTDFLV